MSTRRAYWDLLHAEHSLGEFGNHVFMLDGVDTKIYNAHMAGAYHRILSAKEWLPLGRDEKAELEAEFAEWLKWINVKEKS